MKPSTVGDSVGIGLVGISLVAAPLTAMANAGKSFMHAWPHYHRAKWACATRPIGLLWPFAVASMIQGRLMANTKLNLEEKVGWTLANFGIAGIGSCLFNLGALRVMGELKFLSARSWQVAALGCFTIVGLFGLVLGIESGRDEPNGSAMLGVPDFTISR